MLRVGLTGGIASGKSTVSKIFASFGAKVLDADEVAREVLLPGQPAWTRLRQAFGQEFFHAHGEVKRKQLRKLIFADPEKRSQLNAIVHPEVMKEINLDISNGYPQHVDEFINKNFDYVISVCGSAKESCPMFIGKVKYRLHIGFDDPAEATGTESEILNEFRRIRDEINRDFSRFYIEHLKN